ncbi:hypothetical protein IG631_01181 [Alternaria alternata]|nr:hypothetical protein IG631_01181 [Alternaria alternata]
MDTKLSTQPRFYALRTVSVHDLPRRPRTRLAIGDDILSTPFCRTIGPPNSSPMRHATPSSTVPRVVSSLVCCFLSLVRIIWGYGWDTVPEGGESAIAC